MAQTPGVELGRPAFMRQELGPLLTVATERLVEIAEDESKLRLPTLLHEMDYHYTPHSYSEFFVDFTYAMERLAEESVSEWVELPDNVGQRQAIEELLDAYPNYTFHSEVKDLVRESLVSGMIVPLKFTNLLMQKGCLMFSASQPYQVGCIADAMKTDGFSEMLGLLSRQHPTVLGDWSVNSGAGILRYSFMDELTFVVRDGEVHFSPDSTRKLNSMIKNNNLFARNLKKGPNARNHESGGCPVRHSLYKAVGSVARKGLEADGVDIEALARPDRRSAIEISKDFVIRQIELMDERIASSTIETE